MAMTTRHDFYQNDVRVFISIYRKKVVEDELEIHAEANSLKVAVAGEVLLDLDPLWAEIEHEQTSSKVFGTKVEVQLLKSNPGHSWPSLARSSGDAHQPIASTSTTTTAPPTDRPRRRNKFDTLDLDSELGDTDADPHSDPDATNSKVQNNGGTGTSEKDLERFFQQVYGDLGEEGKRAMMKSFTESGGTVLSTDWGDVGGRKVVPQPPK